MRPGLETLGAPVLEIGLDRLHVALEVVHMAVRRLLAVLLCHRFRLSRPAGQHGTGRMRCSTDIPGDKFFDGVHKAIE